MRFRSTADVRPQSYPRVAFAAVFAMACILASDGLVSSASAQQQAVTQQRRELTGQPWVDMDYGPYLTASLEVEPGNIANKGVAIRLDKGVGGISAGNEFVLFDTDTLRYAACWTGPEFINWENIAFNGEHVVHADIVGHTVFSNPDAPGWADPAGTFKDRRLVGRDKNRYGPMPHEWARWKGLYVHGDKVVLSYQVGGVHVLELPAAEGESAGRTFTRTLNIAERERDLILQVAHDAKARIEFFELPGPGSRHHKVAAFVKESVAAPVTTADSNTGSEQTEQTSGLKFDGRQSVEITNPADLDMAGADFTIYARIKSEDDGTILAKAPASGKWAPNGTTFFLREGRLHYDVGWVGVVEAEDVQVDDGRWHDVAMTWQHDTAQVRFYVDGRFAGGGDLRPKANEQAFAARIGYTSSDFPSPSGFVGQIAELRFYQQCLPAEQLVKDKLGQSADPVALWRQADGSRVRDASGKGHDGEVAVVGGRGVQQPLESDNQVTCAAIVGGPSGTDWIAADDGHLRLRIPAGEPTRIKLVIGQVDDAQQVNAFAKRTDALPEPSDLTTLTQGGPRHWTETVATEVQPMGPQDGAYAVESLTAPMDNPYRSWMRLGGFDFFPSNPTRAAVCTWQGDVWIVDGVGGETNQLAWTRIASGMFQPLGVKIVEGSIYVVCRDQITILRDLNGDGETDFYENFNNDHQVTEHFHEFAMDLQTDAEGNFYYAKSARHARDALVPHHGTLIKVSRDGSSSEILANGFRAANGVCVNGDGTFIISDQEGHWTPKNRINWITPGGFYGNMMGYHEGRQVNDFQQPVVWIHNNFDRSPAEQLWVTSDRWGPLKGSLLNLSYGTGQIHVVMIEDVDGTKQGGLVRLPIPDFPTGVMRGRFHPVDGQLYCCGLFGWSSNKTNPGGFYRVRYTGEPLYLPIGLRASRNGMTITFTQPLDAESAGDYANYAVSRWNYKRTANYGSDDYSVKNPRKKGRDRVRVENAVLSDDKKSVLLEIRDMQPSMQMEITYRIKAADGTELSQTIHNTIHKVGND